MIRIGHQDTNELSENFIKDLSLRWARLCIDGRRSSMCEWTKGILINIHAYTHRRMQVFPILQSVEIEKNKAKETHHKKAILYIRTKT